VFHWSSCLLHVGYDLVAKCVIDLDMNVGRLSEERFLWCLMSDENAVLSREQL